MFYQLVEKYLEEELANEPVKDFKRGQILYHEGDIPSRVYFLEKGMIGLFHISETGKETFYRVFSKDDILGHRSFLAEEPYHASAIALTPVRVKSLSTEKCNEICLKHPQIMRELLKSLAKDLGNSELRMSGLFDKSANRRITESLVYLKLKYPKYVWTRKEIAEYSGSTYETVARVMTQLEKDRLIEKVGRDFNILDPEQLLSAFDS